MKQPDINIYTAFMSGDSVGSLAKRFKLDKSQIRKVIHRVSNERCSTESKVLHELPTNQADTGRDLQGV